MCSVKGGPRFLCVWCEVGTGTVFGIEGAELETVPDETWCLTVRISENWCISALWGLEKCFDRMKGFLPVASPLQTSRVFFKVK